MGDGTVGTQVPLCKATYRLDRLFRLLERRVATMSCEYYGMYE